MLSFFFSSRRRHTRSLRDWSSDVCSSDLEVEHGLDEHEAADLAGEPADHLGPALDLAERCGRVTAPLREGRFQSIEAMTLMFEQAGHDLLQTPLPVTELHATSGRHPVDLLVGE